MVGGGDGQGPAERGATDGLEHGGMDTLRQQVCSSCVTPAQNCLYSVLNICFTMFGIKHNDPTNEHGDPHTQALLTLPIC
jgi:hypothetical protein